MPDLRLIPTTKTNKAEFASPPGADCTTCFGADYVQAAKWYELAATKNSAEGSYKLARLVRVGLGVEPDWERSLKLLKFAADQGHPRAQSEYGDCLMRGTHGVARNPRSALEYYRKAAEQGWVDGFRGLHIWNKLDQSGEPSASETQSNLEESQKQFLAALRKAAEGGDPEMQLRLGQAILEDNRQGNRPDNHSEGCAWVKQGVQGLQERSQRGDAFASVALAWFFKTAPALWKDGPKSRRHLEKAVRQGYRMPSEELAVFAKDYDDTWAGDFSQLGNPWNTIAPECALPAGASLPSPAQPPSSSSYGEASAGTSGDSSSEACAQLAQVTR